MSSIHPNTINVKGFSACFRQKIAFFGAVKENLAVNVSKVYKERGLQQISSGCLRRSASLGILWKGIVTPVKPGAGMVYGRPGVA